MTNRRKIAIGSVGLFFSIIGAASADRINIWRPADIEQLRETYARSGAEFPEDLIRKRDQEAQERLASLKIRLAPADPGEDHLGMHYFEGRILKLLPALDRAAPRNNDAHWPKIIFEAYGPGGTDKSRETVVISTRWIRLTNGDMALDTVADLSRLLSNRHDLIGVPFGGGRHRQALFSAIDPDGSMGLSSGPGEDMPAGLKEGALLVFSDGGAPGQGLPRMQYFDTNPIDPILMFDERGSPGMLTRLIEEYARSRRYPGFEPDYSAAAKAALQMLYTLSFVMPELTNARYQSRARRLKSIGATTYDAIGNALDVHASDEALRQTANIARPFMPLTIDEIRSAMLEVLSDGPVVPVPVIVAGLHDRRSSTALIHALRRILEKQDVNGAVALRVFERQLAPDPGEDPAVTTLFELDRETNRRAAHRIAGEARHEEPELAFFRALARVGWGEGEEVEELIDLILYWATITREGASMDLVNENAVAVLRIVARPDKYTRKDRRDHGIAAAEVLEQRIAEIRERIRQGFGSVGASRFIEIWDSGEE